MRLLIIGMLEGHIITAGQIAISRGATVSQVDSIDAGSVSYTHLTLPTKRIV